MLKTTGRLILAAIFLGLCALLVALAKACPDFLYAWYTRLSRSLMAQVGGVTAKLPFSLAEALLALAALWVVYTLIQVLRGRTGIFAWLAGLGVGVSVIAFWFLAVWGLNYFNPRSLAEDLGLDVQAYTDDQLQAAASWYLTQANALAPEVPRNENGVAELGEFQDLAAASAEGYTALARQWERFSPSAATPKPVLASRLMSYAGITGIYLCLTGEANVNSETPSVSLPFTMAHERAHGQAICPEEECNFAAYLACQYSTDVGCRYSGYYSAFIYCYNALYRQDKTRAAVVWAALSAPVKLDIQDANAHYQQFEGKVQDAAEKVNDTYLKTFAQESGVQSYGQVADLLIAWYLAGAGQGPGSPAA